MSLSSELRPRDVTRLLSAPTDETSDNSSFSALHEAMERHITEFDLAAYTKDEFTTSMEKNIMRRMFCAFDVTQTGFLELKEADELLKYLHVDVSEGQLENKDQVSRQSFNPLPPKPSFEQFWEWWLEIERQTREKAVDAFAVVCADFSVPYHQQQLIVEEIGEKYTPSFRVNFYFKDMETNALKRVSPWHDVPLAVRDLVRTVPETEPANRYNFICEIPKWTRAKFEIATGEVYNPIKQDMKNGVPRFYKHGDMMWNYGAFPQTWESTEVNFMDGVLGDNDPLDAIEIGMTQFKTGAVTAVKVLGILGMIDDGQMDWKVICISHGDPVAKFLNNVDDIPKYLPGCLDSLREWLRVYKICQGGVENKFAFEGEYKDKGYAMKIIDESHLMWNNLKKIHQKTHF